MTVMKTDAIARPESLARLHVNTIVANSYTRSKIDVQVAWNCGDCAEREMKAINYYIGKALLKRHAHATLRLSRCDTYI